MPLKFKCTSCGNDIFVIFLKIGEIAVCKACGQQIPIPEDAEELEHLPKTLPQQQAVPNLAEEEKPKTKEPIVRSILQIVGITINGAFIFFQTIGLMMIPYDPIAMFASLVLIAIPIINIISISSKETKLKKTVITLNVLSLFVYIITAISTPSNEIFVGSLMIIAVNISTLIIISLRGGNSWLSLYLERKRLEEIKRIEALRSETEKNQ